YQVRIQWRPSTKLSLSASAGLENRQFIGSTTPDSLSPIFGTVLVYQLFEPTTFSLSASRAISSSYFQNQTTTTTGFTGNLRQRILNKLYLDIGGGYTMSEY